MFLVGDLSLPNVWYRAMTFLECSWIVALCAWTVDYIYRLKSENYGFSVRNLKSMTSHSKKTHRPFFMSGWTITSFGFATSLHKRTCVPHFQYKEHVFSHFENSECGYRTFQHFGSSLAHSIYIGNVAYSLQNDNHDNHHFFTTTIIIFHTTTIFLIELQLFSFSREILSSKRILVRVEIILQRFFIAHC